VTTPGGHRRTAVALILTGLVVIVLGAALLIAPRVAGPYPTPVASPTFENTPAIPTQRPTPTPPTYNSLAPTLTPTPSPQAPPPSTLPPVENLTLVIVHSNDTWGYIRPCG